MYIISVLALIIVIITLPFISVIGIAKLMYEDNHYLLMFVLMGIPLFIGLLTNNLIWY